VRAARVARARTVVVRALGEPRVVMRMMVPLRGDATTETNVGPVEQVRVGTVDRRRGARVDRVAARGRHKREPATGTDGRRVVRAPTVHQREATLDPATIVHGLAKGGPMKVDPPRAGRGRAGRAMGGPPRADRRRADRARIVRARAGRVRFDRVRVGRLRRVVAGTTAMSGRAGTIGMDGTIGTGGASEQPTIAGRATTGVTAPVLTVPAVVGTAVVGTAVVGTAAVVRTEAAAVETLGTTDHLRRRCRARPAGAPWEPSLVGGPGG